MKKLPKKTRRLFVFHTECIHPRGGEKYIYELIMRVSKKQPIVLCVEKISPYWRRLYQGLCVPIYTLWKPKRMYWALLPITLSTNFWRLHRIIKNEDVLFASIFPLTFLAVLLSRNSIIFCFEPLNIFYDQTFIHNLPAWSQLAVRVIKAIYKPLDSFAIHRGKTLVTLNPEVGKAIRKQYKKTPRFFIPIGVDIKTFTPTAHPLYTFKKQGLFVVGHSTDYTPLKGTEYLLRALPDVIKQKKSILVLISETVANPRKKIEYQNLIRQLHLEKNVVFVGTLPQSKLPGFYTSCNIFCFCGSSLCVGAYSASLSVIEAQASGVPVLRTIGNGTEIVGGKTGFFIHPEETASFSKKLLLFASLSNNKLRFMQKQSLLHAKKYSWDMSANIWRAIIKTTIPQREKEK